MDVSLTADQCIGLVAGLKSAFVEKELERMRVAEDGGVPLQYRRETSTDFVVLDTVRSSERVGRTREFVCEAAAENPDHTVLRRVVNEL